jgi:hypothetical protein
MSPTSSARSSRESKERTWSARERLAFIAAQAYSFGSQLARNPDNADLVPQVEEIKRLKSFVRRKKAAQAPQAPSPGPVTSTAPKA